MVLLDPEINLQLMPFESQQWNFERNPSQVIYKIFFANQDRSRDLSWSLQKSRIVALTLPYTSHQPIIDFPINA